MASNDSDHEYDSEPEGELYTRRFVDDDCEEIDEYVAALQRSCGRVFHYEPEEDVEPAPEPTVIRETTFPSARERSNRKTLILPAISRCVAMMRNRRLQK